MSEAIERQRALSSDSCGGYWRTRKSITGVMRRAISMKR
jgi:hypothetical protein